MKTFERHLRAALRMGLLWASAGFGVGLLLARVSTLQADLPFALLFAPLGFAAGVTFSGILGVLEGRAGFDQTPLPVFAAWGAVSGLLLSGLLVAGAALRGSNPWEELLLFGPGLVLGGAACAAASMSLARRPHGGEQGGPHGTPV